MLKNYTTENSTHPSKPRQSYFALVTASTKCSDDSLRLPTLLFHYRNAGDNGTRPFTGRMLFLSVKQRYQSTALMLSIKSHAPYLTLLIQQLIPEGTDVATHSSSFTSALSSSRHSATLERLSVQYSKWYTPSQHCQTSVLQQCPQPSCCHDMVQ